MIFGFLLDLGRIAINFMFGWLPDAGATPAVISAGWEYLLKFYWQFDFIISFYDSLAIAKIVLGIIAAEYTIYAFAAIYKRIPIIGN